MKRRFNIGLIAGNLDEKDVGKDDKILKELILNDCIKLEPLGFFNHTQLSYTLNSLY